MRAPKLANVESDGTAVSGSRDRPATGRLSLVLDALLDALPSVTASGGAPHVLDCGGGSGAFAVPLARAGAEVTVVDISADALATLARRADEAGVADRVHGRPGDVERLPDVLPDTTFDLVLAHGVLDAVDQLAGTFAGIAGAVRPGGLLSLVVGNPHAAVLARALAGDLRLALVELRESAAADGEPVTTGRARADDVAALAEQDGLVIELRHGVGAFSDLVPGAALDTPAARELLARLDREAAAREPFASLAGRIHLLARRPAR